MENREREFQRPQKPRLRARTQFRARPEVPRHDADGSQSARRRLAHHVRTAGAALADRARSRRQANQLLRPHPHADQLRRLSLLGGPPRLPHDLHYPARTREKPGRPLNNAPIATFRTADEELKSELGLAHFEGRGWRGFHHHATLCIAAYGFLIRERAAFPPSGPRRREGPVLPRRPRPRSAPDPTRAPRRDLDRHPAKATDRRPRPVARPMPVLPIVHAETTALSALMTQ